MEGEGDGTAKSRVLIVEDNSDDEVLLMRQLEKAGLAKNVQVITNGRQALRYLLSKADDLVVP